MKIYIRAEICIEVDMKPKKKKSSKARQTDLGAFAAMRPTKASSKPKVLDLEQTPSKAANGPKMRRSDYGGNHHCSKCGVAGSKVTQRLQGFCKVCHPNKGYSGWA